MEHLHSGSQKLTNLTLSFFAGVYEESSFTRVTEANLFTKVAEEFTSVNETNLLPEDDFVSISTTESSGQESTCNFYFTIKMLFALVISGMALVYINFI